MKYLPDTHILYWFFENPKKLSKQVLEILKNNKIPLLIPSIIIAELKYIFKKYRLLSKFKTIFRAILEDPRCVIIPLDEEIIEKMPIDFEMHDSIIIATAKYFEEIWKEEVIIISCDEEIRNSKAVKVIC